MSASLEEHRRDAARGPEAPPSEAGAALEPANPARHRVLVVDDEESILSSLRRLLRREPYELLTALNAEEALRVLENRTVHLVMSDYRMPGLSGTELLREVQRHWPETMRIVLSGYSEVKAIIAAINEGAIYKFISKPWNDEEVRLNIRRAIEQYDLRAENQRMAREIAEQNEHLRELNELLQERAVDASAGQSLTQDLLETIDAGVLIIDPNGLIVTANRKAWELIQPCQGELIGLSAATVLPPRLCDQLRPRPVSPESGICGRIRLAGRTLQWRARCSGDPDHWRGQVVTLWEEIP